MGACCSRTKTLSPSVRPRNRVKDVSETSDATLDACEEVIDVLYGLKEFPTPTQEDCLSVESETTTYGTPLSQ